MSTFEQREELHRLRRELLVAAAEEHRLHQVANRERESEHRWRSRADLARIHQRESLAAEALARSDLHRQRADIAELEYQDQRLWVEHLRQQLRNPPVPRTRSIQILEGSLSSELETQLSNLEKEARLDRELHELKQLRQPRRALARPEASIQVEYPRSGER